MNFELMKHGFPPIIIKNENRANYYDVLDVAHTTMDYGPFVKFVTELVLESENLWLSVLDYDLIFKDFTGEINKYMLVDNII